MRQVENLAVYIPIVSLKDETKFFEIARDAKLVVYDTETLVKGDDPPKIKKITIYAIGIEKYGLPMTISYRLSITDIINSNLDKDYNTLIELIDDKIKKLILKIKTKFNGIEGRIENPDIQEIWRELY